MGSYTTTQVTATSVILGVGALTNILLVLCLAHTWRYWRQVKFYVILLLVGNFLDVAVTQGIALAHIVNPQTALAGSTASCRFLMFLVTLGPSLSAMAIAALAVHVLLTNISGNQGNRLRHALVMGLFVLLALPMPLGKIPISELYTYNHYDGESSFCLYRMGSAEALLQLTVGESVALVFFPLSIILLCCLAATVLLCNASRASIKGDEDKSDLILTCLLGVVLLVFCSPYFIHQLLIATRTSPGSSMAMIYTMVALMNLMNCFPFITALINIVFGYVHAFRNRGEFYVTSGSSSSASGERQKLVN